MKVEDHLLTVGVSHGRNGRSMIPKGVVVHYVANPGSSAMGNRNYFENGSGGAGVSAHYVIGLNGEIIRCIPDDECAAHAGKSYGQAWNELSKTNNSRMIGIECCHPTADGKFNDYTTDSLVELVVDLCKRFKLDPSKDVFRHYDVCGKSCPLYYVNKSDEWISMKKKIVEKFTQETVKLAAPAVKDSDTPSSWAA